MADNMFKLKIDLNLMTNICLSNLSKHGYMEQSDKWKQMLMHLTFLKKREFIKTQTITFYQKFSRYKA